MTYKDKDRQKAANRDANKRYRDKQKGITQYDDKGITVDDKVIPQQRDTVTPKTIQDVMAMSRQETKALLDSWAEGKGTRYQRSLAMLGRQYDVIHKATGASL